MIILVGIPGCGKSSILREILRQVPSIHVINYGDKMLAEAALEGLSRDGLRKLPIQEQQKIGAKAAEKMIGESNRITIIDTHALIRTEVGYCPGLPREVLEILSPKAYVWIECLPTLILQRRLQDSSRMRDHESEEVLAMHQELSRAYLAACSVATGSILCRITNNTPDIAENAVPLIRLIQSLDGSVLSDLRGVAQLH